MTLVSAGPIVEVTVSPAASFRPDITTTAATSGAVAPAAQPGTFTADISDDELPTGTELTILLFDDASAEVAPLPSFQVAGSGFTSGGGRGTFAFVGATRAHSPRRLDVGSYVQWS